MVIMILCNLSAVRNERKESRKYVKWREKHSGRNTAYEEKEQKKNLNKRILENARMKRVKQTRKARQGEREEEKNY